MMLRLRTFVWRLRQIPSWIKWRWLGKPMIEYAGYNCGLCGRYVCESFQVPEYQSHGKWWDTWSACDRCLAHG